MSKKSILVVGSAHLDVLAKITGDASGIDKPGIVDIEIGGTACNIAINLASLGCQPTLLTALKEGTPYSNIITGHLRENGVEVHVVNHDEMLTAAFSAHVDGNGELISAVSSMPVESAIFSDDLVFGLFRDHQFRCMILECNLSGAMLERFCYIAACVKIPVFVAAVSEEKCMRLREIVSPVSAVFMNRREAEYFRQFVKANSSIENSIGKQYDAYKAELVTENERWAREEHGSMDDIVDYLLSNLVVSLDKDGVSVSPYSDRCYGNGNTEHIIIPALPLTDFVHTLGAGDALVAATVSHLIFDNMNLVDSVTEGMKFAAQVIGRSNCNAGQANVICKAFVTLDNKASRDVMTGLMNRRAGDEILNNAHVNAVTKSIPYSILMVDIDHFKRVNDTHGHDAGDAAIKMVAGVLSHAVRGNDVACRWGGEEFLCILQGADKDIAMTVAERIRAMVEAAEIPVVGKITVSVGVVTWNMALADVLLMVKASDLGLYAAKHGGRNRVAVGGVTEALI